MKYLHWDYESDGLNVEGQPSDHPDQPLPLSVSCYLDDEDGGTIDVYQNLIKPTRPISAEITAINGITFEKADAEGVPLLEAMEAIAALVEKCDVIVGFNNFFDLKMYKIACARLGARGEEMRQLMETKSSVCTMAAAAKFLKAGRFIKLAAAHERLLGDPMSGTAHEADADVNASRRIFYHLRGLGELPEPKSLARKVYDKPPPSR